MSASKPGPKPSAGGSNVSAPTEEEITRQRVNYQINSLRLQPVSSLPMNLFLMWMVGNDVSMFSIMFVGMAVVNPISSILSVNKTFAGFEEEAAKDKQIMSSLKLGKLIYVGCCIVGFLVALLKLTWMGLVPILSMDWMSTTVPAYKERSFGVVV
ncbi:hypothetical protein AGDE_02611 [Angomonas deanei]|uniref:ER membrane protein complex subunit 4 n=1 Tax=Angomonas deanei TaxID=59799 RepID=S9VKE0_9TRYP|nr:hypothetical protein AGDE_05123 [Angomonas deanei]EPY41314.1 hypothetical protein AGDE_02611 [Angomonas deanei]CAD2218145.1 Protein of unknown function (DUF1077), putative [Angomonas deanei]|eukprot:EPY38806.1 hypothetical protein AGDE_05123 [Angomonas deanei]